MSIGQTLLPEFDLEMATTRRVLERVPSEKAQWKPHPKAREALASAKDPDFDVMWSLKHGERVLFSSPRGIVVRQHINHLIHHRGQLTVYLRLIDVPIPSIYGPTADERW